MLHIVSLYCKFSFFPTLNLSKPQLHRGVTMGIMVETLCVVVSEVFPLPQSLPTRGASKIDANCLSLEGEFSAVA